MVLIERSGFIAVSDKIRAILKLQNRKTEDLSKALGLSSTQALYNKLNQDSFTPSDLIRIAEFFDCDLNFEMKTGQKISLKMDDVKNKHLYIQNRFNLISKMCSNRANS